MTDLTELLKLDPDTKEKHFRKGEKIQSAGDDRAYKYYVKKGLLRSYIIDSKGKEHIFMFAPEGWIIADLEAMEFDEPVQLYIECLEDSVIVVFDQKTPVKIDQIDERIPENAHLLYRRIARLQRRVLMLLGSPAIDRYQYFLSTYPELPNRVPQRMIATYLGITPQTLSTIRGEMARSK